MNKFICCDYTIPENKLTKLDVRINKGRHRNQHLGFVDIIPFEGITKQELLFTLQFCNVF